MEERMTSEILTVTDHRTGRTYELPVTDGTIRAMDLRAIKVDDDDFGIMSYDPAFKNTASTVSRITYIDGDKGILRYRGYPIQQLAQQCTFLEVAYLIIAGELPTGDEFAEYEGFIKLHTLIHENIKQSIDGFRYDAHPMGMLISTIAALSTFYPEAKMVDDPEIRRLQMTRLTAKMPTLAAFAYRHAKGYPFVYPDPGLSYAGNFLNMMFRRAEPKYIPNPVLEHALDVLFILHADHEQNCGTNAMRSIGSSRVDPYSAAAGAAAAV
jgi:citrate synthase